MSARNANFSIHAGTTFRYQWVARFSSIKKGRGGKKFENHCYRGRPRNFFMFLNQFIEGRAWHIAYMTTCPLRPLDGEGPQNFSESTGPDGEKSSEIFHVPESQRSSKYFEVLEHDDSRRKKGSVKTTRLPIILPHFLRVVMLA